MQRLIRNFSIIAHIDHGKSTLADRFIQLCGGLSEREMSDQVLDSLQVERERGITVKAQSVTLNYTAKDGLDYQLNFIDTPGHVDFAYEVSRSLAACEGALLVVDAAQGIEAQTVAVCYMAIDQNLEILPVLNKVDLPQADPEAVREDIEAVIGVPSGHAISVSAKNGQGIDELLEQLVQYIPAPTGDRDAPLQALVIDSWFDMYLGVVSLICIKEGCLKKGARIRVMSSSEDYNAEELGIFTPKRQAKDRLQAGEVGYLVAGIKDIQHAPVGDTITETKRPAKKALRGFQIVKPQVFAGLFPVNSEDYQLFRDTLYKLCLNDSAITFEPENSDALGLGFRCGFLGLLHMDVVKERLENEYQLPVITSAPSVRYRITTKKGKTLLVSNPTALPDMSTVESLYEPMVKAHILVPQAHVGVVIRLCVERRGQQIQIDYLGRQVSIVYRLPMNEVVLDFFDRLKSVTRGYASLDYRFECFEQAKLVRLDILINGERVDALTVIVHHSRAYSYGRQLAEKLKEIIPRQMFVVAIQAAIGSHIIARETVSAFSKNVTNVCRGGGDISRKRKLLEKQKAGKKRMKQVGSVTIPQEAFLAILRINRGEER